MNPVHSIFCQCHPETSDGQCHLFVHTMVVINSTLFVSQGLVVPVLRNVETMNYADIEIGVNELGLKVSKSSMQLL